MEQIYDTSTETIAEVLNGYEFESFHTVRLVHPPTGRTLVLPKGRLFQ